MLALISVPAGAAAASATATTGTIRGTVTSSTGAKLAGICVSAQPTGSGNSFFQRTSSSGAYVMGGVAPGSYRVQFTACSGSGTGYVAQWYKGTTNESAATPVVVAAGKTDLGIDAAMRQAGAIAGSVKGPSGPAMNGVCVGVYTAGKLNEVDGSATGSSGGAGGYQVNDLAPGRYDVQFSSGCGPKPVNVLTQWYKGAATQARATVVTVTAGKVTGGIGASMSAGGELTGLVKNTKGVALSGVCVSAASGPSALGGFVTTAPNGTYSIVALATAKYIVSFTAVECGPRSQNYAAQWYKNASTQAKATPVAVTVGRTTGGIDAAMQPGGTITGTVTNAKHAKLAGICVYAEVSKNIVGYTTTTASGTYAMVGLSSGRYDLEFEASCSAHPANYASQWYKNAPSQAKATLVTVTAGKAIGGIDAVMQIGGIVTGKVTSSSGAPLAGIYVWAHSGRTTTVASYAVTAANGTYSLDQLASSSYTVAFNPPNICGGHDPSYETQWYKNATTQAKATLVPVTAGKTKTGIDASLRPTAKAAEGRIPFC